MIHSTERQVLQLLEHSAPTTQGNALWGPLGSTRKSPQEPPGNHALFPTKAGSLFSTEIGKAVRAATFFPQQIPQPQLLREVAREK